MGQARDVVSGLSTDELWQDANLRKYIAKKIKHLRISVDDDDAIENLLRRKIGLAA